MTDRFSALPFFVGTFFVGTFSAALFTTEAVAELTPLGGAFPVNTTATATDARPQTAMDAAGNFVVVWIHFDDVEGLQLLGQRFNGNGKPIGAEFQIDEDGVAGAASFDVAMDDAGSFIVVWEGSTNEDGDIRGRIYDSNGVPNLIGDFRVNDSQTGFQFAPSVTFSDSGFIAAWADNNTDGVAVRVFGTGGMIPGPEQQFPDDIGAAEVQIAGNANGEAVVAWTGYEDSDFTQLTDIYFVRFDSTGMPTTGRMRANTFLTARQDSPKAAMNAAGDFSIVWEEADGGQVGARVYDSPAAPVSPAESTITNTPAFRPVNLDIAMDGDTFTLVYELFGDNGPSILGVQHTFDGMQIGDTFTVNAPSPASRNPTIATDGGSRYVVAYDLTTPPQVVARLYTSASGTTSTSSTTSTTLGSTLCGDADGNGTITASDALLTLSAAVGAAVCRPCRCDLDNSGLITAADALRVLAEAVGLDGMPACMPCA